MLTPLSQPSRLTSMKRSAGPWNQVAIITAPGCQTVLKRSHSPASRQIAQFSTTSRMRSFSVRSIAALRAVRSLWLAGISDVGVLVELDVVEKPVDLLDAPDIDRLHDIARLGIDHDRPARTHELHPFDRADEAVGIGGSAGFLE